MTDEPTPGDLHIEETALDDLPAGPKPGDGLVGRTIGDLRIVEAIGAGGMGELFKAFDPTLQKHFAVKILRSGVFTNQEHRDRFLREARLACRVDDPHVVPILRFGWEEEFDFCVMPFVEGQNLAEYIEAMSDTPAIREVLDIAIQAARGLAALHAAGIVHRDVKPSNIMIEKGGRVRITDLGIARGETDKDLTSTGQILGTPQFMSPEQAYGRPTDHRSDIYSLGLTLFFLLTGRCPYEGDSALGILNAQCSAPLPDPTRTNPRAGSAPLELLERMTAKDPDDRPQTMDEVVRALERASKRPGRRSSRVARRAAAGRRRPPWVLPVAGGLAALFVAIAALAATGVLGSGRDPDPAPAPPVATDDRPPEPDRPPGDRPDPDRPPAVDPEARAAVARAFLEGALGSKVRIVEITADGIRAESTFEFGDDTPVDRMVLGGQGYLMSIEGGSLVARRDRDFDGPDEDRIALFDLGQWSRPFEVEIDFRADHPEMSSLDVDYLTDAPDDPEADSYVAQILGGFGIVVYRFDAPDGDSIVEGTLDEALSADVAYRLTVRLDADGNHEVEVRSLEGGPSTRVVGRDHRMADGPVELSWLGYREIRIDRIRIEGLVGRQTRREIGD